MTRAFRVNREPDGTIGPAGIEHTDVAITFGDIVRCLYCRGRGRVRSPFSGRWYKCSHCKGWGIYRPDATKQRP